VVQGAGEAIPQILNERSSKLTATAAGFFVMDYIASKDDYNLLDEFWLYSFSPSHADKTSVPCKLVEACSIWWHLLSLKKLLNKSN